MSRQSKILLFIAAIGLVFGLALHVFQNSSSPAQPATSGISKTLQVVAAENFWGSLVSEIGGTHVQVLSIVSDPNADPHEYETNTANARAVAGAAYVIENGAGYDSWMDKLLNASPNQNRTVLNVAGLLGQQEGANPHFWYSPDYVDRVTAQMEHDLAALDPANAAYYEAQYQTLQASLAAGYKARIANIKQQFGGTKVAATEDIFSYLANAAGLNLISPPAFIQAVAEGNDPPAQSVVQFENQLKGGTVHLLVYNEQTVTPITEYMKKLAASNVIPVVGITETIQPPSASFEEWMNAELINLENGLTAKR